MISSISNSSKFKSITTDQKGFVIVEASIVFPIMFLVLIFLIYFGNAYYQKARIDAIVVENAILGASYCSNPITSQVIKKKSVDDLKSVDIQPYRHLFGGMNKIELEISNQILNNTNDIKNSTFFSNMMPKITTNKNQIAKFNNYVIYSTFSVELLYEIEFPIKFFGEKTSPILKLGSRAEIPINDTVEFVRNTDMVIDLFEDTSIGRNIPKVFQRINTFIKQFADK